MTKLNANNLTVRRGRRDILDGVSLALSSGAFVAVVGANGAGKSTLLSVLAGLLRPDAGEAFLDGADIARLDAAALARRRAYLPQNPTCEWPISVERLVALGLTPKLPALGRLSGGLEPTLTNAIEAWDLAEHRHQPATTLSGGELARAMLARALIAEPDLLIADEPISGLDPRHALDTVVRLRALALDEGRLVIAAVHDLTLAARYSTHVLALRKGALAAFGPTAEVLGPELLREVFEIEGRIVGEAGGAVVDFARPHRPSG